MAIDMEKGVTLDLDNALEIGRQILSALDGSSFSITVIDALHGVGNPRVESGRVLTDKLGPSREKVPVTVLSENNYAHVGLITNAEAWSISNTNHARVRIKDHVVVVEQMVDKEVVRWEISPEKT